MSQLYRLIYASRGQQQLCMADLRSVMNSTGEHDQDYQIRGLLCLSQHRFVQVLEGPGDDIQQIFERLVRHDSRPQIKLIQFSAIEERAIRGPGIRMINLDVGSINAWLRSSKLPTAEDSFRPDRWTPEIAIERLKELDRQTAVPAPVSYQHISEALIAF